MLFCMAGVGYDLHLWGCLILTPLGIFVLLRLRKIQKKEKEEAQKSLENDDYIRALAFLLRCENKADKVLEDLMKWWKNKGKEGYRTLQKADQLLHASPGEPDDWTVMEIVKTLESCFSSSLVKRLHRRIRKEHLFSKDLTEHQILWKELQIHEERREEKVRKRRREYRESLILYGISLGIMGITPLVQWFGVQLKMTGSLSYQMITTSVLAVATVALWRWWERIWKAGRGKVTGEEDFFPELLERMKDNPLFYAVKDMENVPDSLLLVSQQAMDLPGEPELFIRWGQELKSRDSFQMGLWLYFLNELEEGERRTWISFLQEEYFEIDDKKKRNRFQRELDRYIYLKYAPLFLAVGKVSLDLGLYLYVFCNW